MKKIFNNKLKMKKRLLILICVPIIGFGQQTYVPDDNFEQELINLGYDNILDDSVLTANINTVNQLYVNNRNIVDLTGIKDFVSLQTLDCNFNPGLVSLDLSNNLELISISANQIFGTQQGALNYIDVSNCDKLETLSVLFSQVSYVNVSNCPNLFVLNLENNMIYSIDISNNINLETFIIDDNLISSVDMTNNPNLKVVDIGDNPNIECVDLRNGNNTNINAFYSSNTPLLNCISVDDSSYTTNNWTNISSNNTFSENDCPLVCSSYSCSDSLFVTDVIINYNDSTIEIGVYNGYSSFLSYPYVAYTLDFNGDTLHTGFLNSFGTFSNDTSWYMYPLSLFNTALIPLTISFVYTLSSLPFFTGTCMLKYNSIISDFNEEFIVSKAKLLKIIDISGRETKFSYNTPLFYVYDNGTVEKIIIIN